MQLEVNQDHKKITKFHLNNPLRRIAIGLLGTTMAINMFSGFAPTVAYADDGEQTSIEQQVNDTDIVDVPYSIKLDICFKFGKTTSDDVTVRDLKSLDYMYISSIEGDMSFLKYCTNLESIIITARDIPSLDFLKLIPNLKSITFMSQYLDKSILDQIPALAKVEELGITSIWEESELSKENTGFFGKLPNLKKLYVSGLYLSPDIEEELSHLEEIELGDNVTYDIDFSKLPGLKKITFNQKRPYDIAIYFSTVEYNTLKQAGVELDFGSPEVEKKYLEIAEKLDSIVENLDITETSTDQEKLDAILMYILENLEYDPEVSERAAQNNKSISLSRSFYIDGDLYAVFEKETAICGNYAALLEALMDRVNLPSKSTIIHGNEHAWNLVIVDGETYAIDATWLDGEYGYRETKEDDYDEAGRHIGYTITFEPITAEEMFREGRASELTWYMPKYDLETLAEIDEKGTHLNIPVPQYMLVSKEVSEEQATTAEETLVYEQEPTPILPSTDEDIPDITDKKFKLKLGPKEYIIGGGVLVGILSGLGVAFAIKKKKERERRRRFQQSYTFDDGFDSYFSDDSSYGNSSYSSYRR